MNNTTKYNLKPSAAAAVGLVLLLSSLSYLTAPSTDKFELNSINPVSFLEGFVFVLSFGLGVPVWLSVIVTVGLGFLIFMAFLRIARKVIK